MIIDQQRSLLAPEKTVRDVLAEGGDWIDVRGRRKHVQGYLKDFLFDPGLVDARSATLSGGERSRLLLAREFARKSNLLVLDEPTNDLDLETLDLLQEVIADYDGTVLIVSHDRDFLDRTVTVTLGLDGSGQGRYRRRRLRGLGGEAIAKNSGLRACGTGRGRACQPTLAHPQPLRKREGNKLTYKDQRDYDLLPARDRGARRRDRRATSRRCTIPTSTPRSGQFAALTERIDRSRREGRGRGALARARRAGRAARSLVVSRARRFPLPARLHPLVDPPFEDRQRHHAFLQDLVELAQVEFRRRARPAP